VSVVEGEQRWYTTRGQVGYGRNDEELKNIPKMNKIIEHKWAIPNDRRIVVEGKITRMIVYSNKEYKQNGSVRLNEWRASGDT